MRSNFILLCIFLFCIEPLCSLQIKGNNKDGTEIYINPNSESSSILNNTHPVNPEPIFNMDSIINKYKGIELSLSNVSNAIIDMEIEYPELVLRQSIKESGINRTRTSYTSKLAIKCNNLFGMRKARSRVTYAQKKTYVGYARFEHWIYSIADYKLWQQSNPIKTNETFANYLHRRKYAENSKVYGKNLAKMKIPSDIQLIFDRRDS